MEGYLILLEDENGQVEPEPFYFRFRDGVLYYYRSPSSQKYLGGVELYGHKVSITELSRDQAGPGLSIFPYLIKIETQRVEYVKGNRRYRGALKTRLLASASSSFVRDEWCSYLRGWKRRSCWDESQIVSTHGESELHVLEKIIRKHRFADLQGHNMGDPVSAISSNESSASSNGVHDKRRVSDNKQQDLKGLSSYIRDIAGRRSSQLCVAPGKDIQPQKDEPKQVRTKTYGPQADPFADCIFSPSSTRVAYSTEEIEASNSALGQDSLSNDDDLATPREDEFEESTDEEVEDNVEEDKTTPSRTTDENLYTLLSPGEPITNHLKSQSSLSQSSSGLPANYQLQASSTEKYGETAPPVA